MNVLYHANNTMEIQLTNAGIIHPSREIKLIFYDHTEKTDVIDIQMKDTFINSN